MNAQQLKNSILQEAIEGRLVPQDPNDEPASVLLERIRKEKKRLVKEQKTTLSKPEKACVIKEDGEFPLPQNWKWAMVNDICRVFGRIGFRGYTKNDLRYSQENAAISISPSNMVNGKMDFSNCTYISEEKYEESPEIKIQNGDILIVKTGSSYGKTSLVENLPWKSTINPQIAVVKDVKIEKQFLVYFFQSPYAQSKFKDFVLGTSIPTFSQLNLISLQIPLPPLAEQHRIVAKIEELLPEVEGYGEGQETLDKLNAKLPEQLKKSILQEAIEGRLVSQDPNDEPASVLLEKIRKEKKRLVKEGKLKKKDLEEVPVKEDEINFELPKHWLVMRLGEMTYNHGQKTPIDDFSYIDIGSIDNKRQKLNEVENIIKAKDAPSRARKIVEKGDVVYATVRPYLHNLCIIDKDFSKEPIASTGFAVLACVDGLYNKFLFYYLLSPIFDSYANDGDNAKGMAYPAINDKKLYNGIIPLPPLAEQHRIVSKIEQLLQEIDKLKE